jgi:hypothetical protein
MWKVKYSENDTETENAFVQEHIKKLMQNQGAATCANNTLFSSFGETFESFSRSIRVVPIEKTNTISIAREIVY